MGTTVDAELAAQFAAYLREREHAEQDKPVHASAIARKVIAERGTGVEQEPVELDNEWKLRLGRQLVPFPVIALLWAGAEVASAADALPGAAAIYLTSAVTWWLAWAKRNPTNRAQRRRYGASVTVAGGAWLAWATARGVPGADVLLLWAGAYAAALPYWRRNSIPIPPDPNLSIEEPAPTLEVNEQSWIAQRYAEVIASPDGALPGSYLTDPQTPKEGTERHTIQMRGGKHTTQTAISATSRIASAFGLGMDSVSVEPYPTGDQSKALLTVALDNSLAVTSHYPGPLSALDMTGGGIRAWIGKRADGSDVWWDFFRKDWGTAGGVVIGGTRSGKSKLLSSIMTSAAYSKLITVLPACPQGGASFPLWMKHGHWPARGTDEILLQARAIDRALTIRSKINELRGVEIHVPTELEPILLWPLDECHQVLKKANDEMVVIADRVARQGAKVGIALIAASQYPGLETFGNKDSLRNSLLAGNGICLRIDTSAANQMLPGLVGNPAALPKYFPDGKRTSGLGLVVGENPSPFRAGLVRDQGELAANAPEGCIEKATAAYMGPDYIERKTRILTSRAELAAEIERHDPAVVAAITANDPELAAALDRQKLAPKAPVSRATSAASGEANVVMLAPAPTLRLPEAAPTLTTTDRTATAADVILGLLRQGVTTKKDLMERSGKSETQVRNVLNAFMAEGKVCKVGHGDYRLTAA